jgi:hypothetical protein
MICGILPTSDNSLNSTSSSSSSSSILLSSYNEWLSDELIISAYNSINNIDTVSSKIKWGYNQLISYRYTDEEYLSSSPLLHASKDFIRNCLELNPKNRYGPWKQKEIYRLILINISYVSLNLILLLFYNYSHEFFKYDDTNIDFNLVNNGTFESPNIEFDKRVGFLDLIDDSECISQEEQTLFNEF